MSLPRLHLFELEDQSWFPALWRDYMTDYLGYVERVFGLERLFLPPLRRLLEHAAARHIVDLGSGSGGPLPELLKKLSEEGLEVSATLTDLYPHESSAAALERSSRRKVRYHSRPVDARAASRELVGARTSFNSLHHFRPSEATAILADAARAGEPIGVFEVADRNPAAIAPLILVPLFVLLFTPAIRPFRWSRLLWTYLAPVLPLAILWDGVVSYLRAYTPDELRRMGEDAAPGYRWEAGYHRGEKAPARITYLLGFPKTGAGGDAPSSASAC